MNPALAALLGIGMLAVAATFAGTVAALVTDDAPFRLQLAPVWMIAAVFGLLCLRIAFVVARMLRARALWRIDDAGVTNVKDGIGPIAWADIRGASIRELPYVPRSGGRSALFVEVPEIAARRHLEAASLLARLSQYPSAQGLTAIPVMDAPPCTVPQLEAALEQIRARAGLAG